MIFSAQYEFVKSSRKVLFAYCNSLPESDFLVLHNSFAGASVRNLLMHIGNMYEYWIGQQALGGGTKLTDFKSVATANEAEAYFFTIDNLVEDFITTFTHTYLADLVLAIEANTVYASPLKMFTHVITHEFHHKGQLLSLTRRLGHIPVDTDVIR